MIGMFGPTCVFCIYLATQSSRTKGTRKPLETMKLLVIHERRFLQHSPKIASAKQEANALGKHDYPLQNKSISHQTGKPETPRLKSAVYGGGHVRS